MKLQKNSLRWVIFIFFYQKNANFCDFLLKKIAEMVDKRKFVWYNVYIHTFAFPPLSLVKGSVLLHRVGGHRIRKERDVDFETNNFNHNGGKL